MTSEQAIKSLTPAQRRMYTELQEPMRKGQRAWYFRGKREQRSTDALVRMGWAECVERDTMGNGYRLTDLGKLIAGPVVYTPSAREGLK